MTKNDFSLPTQLSKTYSLLRELGEGANGVTWLARNQISGELVAIKSLRLSISEDFKSFDLFKREAQTLASIHVRGVPAFYESYISENAGGECYIVQQYIDAPSILSLIQQKGRLSERETLFVMLHIAYILVSLHLDYAPAIIHRDIKPSNILCHVDEDGEFLDAFLIDFGAVANPQTKSGGSTIAGTFGYMAPEQLQGECTVSSDYYALGATALHMLTGIEPYKLSSDVFKLHFEDTLKAHAPDTSVQMAELLAILLAPKASDRPENPKIIVQMIQNVLDGKTPKQDEPPAKKRRFEWLSKLLNAQTNKSIKPTEKWVQVEGIVRIAYKDIIEYTFLTEDGEAYCGATYALNISNFAQFCDEESKQLGPSFLNGDIERLAESWTYTLSQVMSRGDKVCCIVQYNPKDPMYNRCMQLIAPSTEK